MLVVEALGAALAPLPYSGSAVLATELLALAGAPEAVDGRADRRQSLAAPSLLTEDLSRLAHGGRARRCPGLGRRWGHLRAGPGRARPMHPAWSGWHWARHGHRSTGPTSPGCSSSRRGAADPARSKRPVDHSPPGKFDPWLALALTVVSADIVGAMRQGLEQVVAYTKERVQYGVPVGSFQAVQHLCAEALVAVEGIGQHGQVRAPGPSTSSIRPRPCWPPARPRPTAGSQARTVAETIMQVYGGIGQTWEHIAHFVDRRNMLDRALFGDDAVQLSAIADARWEVTEMNAHVGGR